MMAYQFQDFPLYVGYQFEELCQFLLFPTSFAIWTEPFSLMTGLYPDLLSFLCLQAIWQLLPLLLLLTCPLFHSQGILHGLGTTEYLYFPRNFIITAKHLVMVEAIKYLGKNMTICLILACEKEAIYMWQNSILIFYINTFQRKLFTQF